MAVGAVLCAVVVGTLVWRGLDRGAGAGPSVEVQELAASPTAWRSGASGDGVVDGSFGDWRGDPVTIAGTWNDNSADTQVNQWTLLDGADYGAWEQDLDVAVGAIYKDAGESWADAAAGAYDDRWRSTLQRLADEWSGRPGTLYLRFAHEFNGDWYPWSVGPDEVDDFRSAWSRFRALQQEVMPDALLVFCPTSESTPAMGLDWTDAVPEPDEVDVMGVDFYNQFPYVDDYETFEERLDATDARGAPRGLEAHRAFSESLGLPFAVPEWSSNATMGDGEAFMLAFRAWVAEQAGSGAGEVVYEIQFNVGGFGEGQFQLFPSTRQPDAARAYRKYW